MREQAMEGAGGTHGSPGQEQPGAFGGYDHLLLGTSLPWLLPHFVHDVEAWNASVCCGRRGGRWARIGEDLRQRGDLEHWAAFPESFDALTDTIATVGGAPGAPATISVLSGDVHHAYVAAPDWSRWSSRPPRSQVRQLTCSPVHNSIYASIRLGFRFGWSAAGRALGRLLPAPWAGAGLPPDVAQDGRALVRQPAHDADPPGPQRPAAAGPGAVGRLGRRGPAGDGPGDGLGRVIGPLSTVPRRTSRDTAHNGAVRSGDQVDSCGASGMMGAHPASHLPRETRPWPETLTR